MKKLCGLIFALTVIAAFIFMPTSGFASAEGRQLTTPTNVKLTLSGENYFMTWARVADNNGYTVVIDGNEYVALKDAEMLNVDAIMDEGVEYEVRVKANADGDNTDSEYSSAVTIVRRGKLSTPANLSVTGQTPVGTQSAMQAVTALLLTEYWLRLQTVRTVWI